MEDWDVDEISPKMIRKKSFILTDQGEHGTCYAHSTSKVFTRFIKVIFSPLFKNQKEECHWLYNTYSFENYLTNELTWQNCESEMLSSLIFLFFYSIVVSKFGFIRGTRVDSFNEMRQYLIDNYQLALSSYGMLIIDKLLSIINYNTYKDIISPERKEILKKI